MLSESDEVEECRAAGSEGLAMMGRQTVAMQSLDMPRGRVACILRPSVVRMRFVELSHQEVSCGLGEDGCCRYRSDLAIALDDAGVRDCRGAAETVAVDEKVLGCQRQGFDCSGHGDERGLEDVDAIDLFGRYDADGMGKGLFDDDLTECHPSAFGQLLGVVQTGYDEVGRKDHRCRHDRTGDAAPSGFVTSGFEA